MAARVYKRNKSFYIEFALYSKGKRIAQASRVLGQISQDEANNILQRLKTLYEKGAINPYQPEFDVKKSLLLPIDEKELERESKKTITLSNIVDKFLIHKRHLKTIEKYRVELDAFLANSGLRHVDIKNVKVIELEYYIWSPKAKVKESTRSYWYRTLHALFEFAKNELKVIDENPLKNIAKPKTKTASVDKIATDSEIEKVIQAYRSDLEERKKSKQYREWQSIQWFIPIIRLYNATGCRREQPLDCKWKHVEEDFSGIWVQGIKFEMHDRVYYHIKDKKARAELKQLKLENNGQPEDYIFRNQKTKRPITGKHVLDTFKRFCKMARVRESLTIHGLRHKSVTDDLNSGVDSAFVALQHKHHSPAFTIKNYAHLTNTSLKDTYKRIYDEREKKKSE